MGGNKRARGIRIEHYVINKLKEIFPDAASTRSESRRLDSLGIDVVNVPHHIQIKSGEYYWKVEDVIKRIEDAVKEGEVEDRPVAVIKVYRNKKGKKRDEKNTIAIMRISQFKAEFGQDDYEVVHSFRRSHLDENQAVFDEKNGYVYMTFKWYLHLLNLKYNGKNRVYRR